jgi:hypothetical protein
MRTETYSTNEEGQNPCLGPVPASESWQHGNTALPSFYFITASFLIVCWHGFRVDWSNTLGKHQCCWNRIRIMAFVPATPAHVKWKEKGGVNVGAVVESIYD